MRLSNVGWCALHVGLMMAAPRFGRVLTAQQHVAATPVPETRTEALLARPVTVDLDRVSLKQAVNTIARNATVRLQYRVPLLNAVTTPVTLHATNLPLGAAFDRVLAGTNLRAVALPNDLIVIEAMNGNGGGQTFQGIITGTVLDARTKQPLVGAAIALDGATNGVVTDAHGAFRLTGVSAGAHTMTVKMLGYGRKTQPLTVTDDAVATVSFALEPSAVQLEQMVVTGTVVQTELKAVPNAITVITTKDIAQRGITHIDQMFRGDVPGLFAENRGAVNPLNQVAMFSRGASRIVNDPTTSLLSAQIKTYVDGVELADPTYLSQIDPRSIERIEILTGPQASTIYGSNALNGVMQIFTKRGTTAHPQVTATLLSGTLQNNMSAAVAPQHDYSMQVSGSEGRVSYHAGTSWNYIGHWTPSIQQSITSVFGGVRGQIDPVTVDASFRTSTTQNTQHGNRASVLTGYIASGLYGVSNLVGLQVPGAQVLDGQTMGLTFGYAPRRWWSHELDIGRDVSNTEIRALAPAFSGPRDTMLSLIQGSNSRVSARYATTVQIPLAEWSRVTVTTGGDGWHALITNLSVAAPTLTGALSGTTTVRRQPGHNTGGFIQAQLGVRDGLFLTYGLRAEWNPNYGVNAQPNYTTRYGIAYTRDYSTPFGQLTAKLRGSYGYATRPPETGQKASVTALGNGFSYQIPDYGNYLAYLSNPALGPETRGGGEGGLELYFGGRSALTVTHYNETVDRLIRDVPVDSARSLGQFPNYYDILGTDGYGYVYQYQYLNVGSIRNQGWELQGSVNTGPLTTKGTYSWTKSRLIGITPQYREAFAGVTAYQPGASIYYFPEHTWALSTSYGRAGTTVMLNVMGTGQLPLSRDPQYYRLESPSIRLNANKVRLTDPRDFVPIPGYATMDLNATHRFTNVLEGVLQVQNLTDRYQNDYDVTSGTLGRQSKVGIRLRW